MSEETKIKPVKAHTIPDYFDAYPILGGDKGDELLGYKVEGVILPLAEFEKKFVLVKAPKAKDKLKTEEKPAE